MKKVMVRTLRSTLTRGDFSFSVTYLGSHLDFLPRGVGRALFAGGFFAAASGESWGLLRLTGTRLWLVSTISPSSTSSSSSSSLLAE